MSKLRVTPATFLLFLLLVVGCTRGGSPPAPTETTSTEAAGEAVREPTQAVPTPQPGEDPSESPASAPEESDDPGDEDGDRTERYTITETVDPDGNVVSFPNEPFTLEVSCERIVVVPTVGTSVLVYVSREGVVAPESDEELSFDGMTDRAVLELDLSEGSWAWSVTVVVNDATQVANVGAALHC